MKTFVIGKMVGKLKFGNDFEAEFWSKYGG